MNFNDVPAFLVELRRQDTVAAWALEFAILTATRASETLGATWDEIDTGSRMWILIRARTKTGLEHRVPLSEQALLILQRAAAIRSGQLIFPGRDSRRPLPVNSLNACLAGRAATAHGMRATFRSWAAEKTDSPREICEAALAMMSGQLLKRLTGARIFSTSAANSWRNGLSFAPAVRDETARARSPSAKYKDKNRGADPGHLRRAIPRHHPSC